MKKIKIQPLHVFSKNPEVQLCKQTTHYNAKKPRKYKKTVQFDAIKSIITYVCSTSIKQSTSQSISHTVNMHATTKFELNADMPDKC